MDQGPLVMDEIETAAQLAAEYHKFEPVYVAFWMKESDAERTYFYIASERTHDLHVAYAEVVRLVNQLDSDYFDLYSVKLISKDDALAKAVAEVRDQRIAGFTPKRLARRAPIREGGRMFGDVFADSLLIYPPIADA